MSLTDDGRNGVVDHKRVLSGARPSDSHRMPTVVVQAVTEIVPDADGPVAQVDGVVNVAVDQLDPDKVLAFSSVVENDSFRLQRLELEVDVGRRVGLQLGQSDVGVLRFEIHRMVNALLSRTELCRDVGRSAQLAGTGHIDQINTVEVELLDLADEIRLSVSAEHGDSGRTRSLLAFQIAADYQRPRLQSGRPSS